MAKRTKKEIRVYMIDITQHIGKYIREMTDEEFIEVAEQQGLVHSLKGFEDSFNRNGIDCNCLFIRFIKVDCYE